MYIYSRNKNRLQEVRAFAASLCSQLSSICSAVMGMRSVKMLRMLVVN